MRFLETHKIVPILAIADHGAGVTMDAFKLTEHGHATCVFMFGADVDGDAVLTCTQGATAGANTAALPFDYAYTAVDINSDGAETFSALANDADGVLTLTEATYENRMLVLEIDGKSLTDGYDWVDIRLSAAATAATISGIAIMSEGRYVSDLGETVLS